MFLYFTLYFSILVSFNKINNSLNFFKSKRFFWIGVILLASFICLSGISDLMWVVLLILIVYRNFKYNINVTLEILDALCSLPTFKMQESFKHFAIDKYLITHSNVHKYMKILLKNELRLFAKLIEDTKDDFKVFFTSYEPEVKISPKMEKLYLFIKKQFRHPHFFRYKPYEFKTDEEFIKARDFWEKARDPRLPFNKVSHMPIPYTFKLESDLPLRTLVMNTSIFYNFFKSTVLALFCAIIYFLYTIFFFKIQFLKQLSVWFVVGMLFFWLISGFNFFIKRYQFGKFTSQIQRFWKRTNTSFWLIEGFLILLFFYYFLNSSQEPVYMYDYSSLNQEYLISLQTIFINIVLLSLIIYFMYFVMLRINSNSWQQLSLYLIIISVFIFFSFFLETYQFYYVISTFNERVWSFNEEDNLWIIDIDSPILRAKQNYLLVCLIAKYWHFLFIFLSWVFFLIKSLERKKVTYVLYGANLQNIIILYALNFACYIQWFKWLYRRFFDLPYTWFMTSIDNKFFFRFYSETKLILVNIFNLNKDVFTFFNLVHKSINVWNVDSLAFWKFL